MNRIILLLTGIALLSACTPSADDGPKDKENHSLYYTSPAAIWEETLPLGNGRLGMMPDGGIQQEHIVLNEISLWSGSEADYANPEASKCLPAIRQLLFQGRNREAQELMYKSFVPRKPESGGTYGCFQNLGELDILFHPAPSDTLSRPDDYRRELDLRNGVVRTSFTLEGVKHRRTCWVSRAHDVMFIHLQAEGGDGLDFTARLSRKERGTLSVQEGTLLLEGSLDSGIPDTPGMGYRVAMRLLAPQGETKASAEEGLSFTGGDEAWLVISATTSFQAAGTAFPGERYATVCDSLLQEGLRAVTPVKASSGQANHGKFDALEAHAALHRELYDRVSLTLPATPADTLPTDQRILHFATEEAPALAALYYNYGRYLLISSTRPGSLPPNLQGLWADGIYTPWNGDYHTNINIQMNHWPLEQAGLSELIEPLTGYVERLTPSGRESARAFYGSEARGWVLHMMSNVWNYTAPGEHPSWGATNTGGAWLCAHLWDHYEFTCDTAYLRRVYPLLKGAADFFHSTMVREPLRDWLVTAPSSSPENAFYVGNDPTPVSVCMGPTMDVQLVSELYDNVIRAGEVLGVDADFADTLRYEMRKMPPMQVGLDGRLQEWLEEYREQDEQHRHVSHLYGLHPGRLITPDATPQLAQACRATLERRGDGGTGWSRAWKINFWARLGNGDRAWRLFHSLLQPAVDTTTHRHGSGTFPNLFCSHPPFQIDGNFGGTAGIGEMLLQSHAGHIELLPALPTCWQEGSFKGMRVRGGGQMDAQWKEGRLVKATLQAPDGGTFRLKMPLYAGKAILSYSHGRKQQVQDRTIELQLATGEKVEIKFR
ncbi:MAG: glycoside hydrolase family 95 protein [Bacteroides sp.]|nr:glycoside hydrolase family 95 protein [Bacteroides sp.]